MTHEELPSWIRDSMTSLGIEKRDFDGGLIEVEFWLRVVSGEAEKHAADAKALAEAVSKYREQVNIIGAANMMQSMMDKSGHIR